MHRACERRQIVTPIHGSYLVEVPETGGRAPLLVGFHGYSETAEDHLAKLRLIPGAARWLLCAVEGLHRFYTRTGEVVGSWMTRHAREQAIVDNVGYVARVLAELKGERETAETLVFAGFSQGVAMAYRAAVGSGFACHGLMALAGDVPPEVAAHRRPGLPRVLIGRGTADPLYTEIRMAADLRVLAAKGVVVETCVFEGGHEWAQAFLAAAGSFLQRVGNAGSAGVSPAPAGSAGVPPASGPKAT